MGGDLVEPKSGPVIAGAVLCNCPFSVRVYFSCGEGSGVKERVREK